MHPIGRARPEYRLLLVAVTLGYSRVFFVSRAARQLHKRLVDYQRAAQAFQALSAYSCARDVSDASSANYHITHR